jgi:hypothetical protein
VGEARGGEPDARDAGERRDRNDLTALTGKAAADPVRQLDKSAWSEV